MFLYHINCPTHGHHVVTANSLQHAVDRTNDYLIERGLTSLQEESTARQFDEDDTTIVVLGLNDHSFTVIL